MSGQLLSGDIIEQADGQTLMGMYMADVVSLISVRLALFTPSKFLRVCYTGAMQCAVQIAITLLFVFACCPHVSVCASSSGRA